MKAKPISGEFQVTSEAAPEEIINKLNELDEETEGVGPNYYQNTAALKVRFGDHSKGSVHQLLTPQQIQTVRAYMDNQDETGANPVFKHVRALFKQADEVLERAEKYLREEQAKPVKPAEPAKPRRTAHVTLQS